MKIGGRTPGINKGFVELHRPGGELFRLAVQALPYGFFERALQEIPDPRPNVEFARDRGGAVIRDEFGLAVKTEKKDDPEYLRQLGCARRLRMILAIREGLCADPNVTFEADAKITAGPHGVSLADIAPLIGWAPYAEAVEKEFRAAGFTDAELVRIHAEIMELNRGGPKRVEDKTEGFLSETPSASPGSSPSAPAAPSGT